VGVSHTVIPALKMEPWDDAVRYFAKEGIDLPAARPPCRLPTLADLREVLAGLSGYSVDFHSHDKGVDVDINNEETFDGAVIWAKEDTAVENGAIDLYFHRGSQELAVWVVQRLARRCGPMLLMVNMEEPHYLTG
jgi:hypothetical protein